MNASHSSGFNGARKREHTRFNNLKFITWATHKSLEMRENLINNFLLRRRNFSIFEKIQVKSSLTKFFESNSFWTAHLNVLLLEENTFQNRMKKNKRNASLLSKIEDFEVKLLEQSILNAYIIWHLTEFFL